VFLISDYITLAYLFLLSDMQNRITEWTREWHNGRR